MFNESHMNDGVLKHHHLIPILNYNLETVAIKVGNKRKFSLIQELRGKRFQNKLKRAFYVRHLKPIEWNENDTIFDHRLEELTIFKNENQILYAKEEF